MSAERQINKQFSTDKLRVDYAHVGLYDVADRRLWIARKRWGIVPVRISHARMLIGGTQTTSTADKDRFICYWYHTPGTGDGFVHGHPIDWSEGHLLIRSDPNWNYTSRTFIPNTDTAKIEKNAKQQYNVGRRIFESYAAKKPEFPLTWHLIGPRVKDSIFEIQRVE